MNFRKPLILRAWSVVAVAVLLCLLSSASHAGTGGLSVSPGYLNFGNCTVGTASVAEKVTVTNTSRQSVQVQSVSLSSLQFAYSGPTLPLVLGPGQSFSGSVMFLPTGAQQYSGQLTFQHSSGYRWSTTVQLHGTGIAAPTSTPTSTSTSTSTPVRPTITWATPTAIAYGTALSATQLDATASAAGSFSYSPGLGTVLNAGNQTLSVTFTPTDTTNYATATDSVVLTVAKATPAISWAAPAAITYGTALSTTQLDATATTAGNFGYSPALGTVLGAGKQALSVTFTPSNATDYNTTTGSVTLTVNKATPTVTWPTPAAITSGTALSSTQLDATANTSGTFAYSPTFGTILSAGTQTLSVTFTPTDTTDYNTATASVVLTVNSPTSATGTLTVTPTSVNFGNVNVGVSSSQTVTVTNSGSGSVSISNLSISGPGVGASGVSTGMVLTGGQTASLGLTFVASSTGSVSGGVTIVSNASDSSLTIPVLATGVSHSVSLSWSADSSATGGYNVYSSTTSGGPYNRLNSSPVTTLAYADATVQSGLTYYYVVTAIDATTNMESGYSNTATAVIP